VAETGDLAEHRHRRRGRGGAAGARLGGGDQRHRPDALLLFVIIFVWTPPHFWALAIARRDEYARAGIPMLPVTHGLAYRACRYCCTPCCSRS